MSHLTTADFRERLKRLRLSVAKATQHSRQRQRVSRSVGQGTSFESHRPYAPGDDLRYTDWNVYGRLDQFVQKQFSTPGEMNLLLIPDLSPTMGFGKGRRTKFRLAKEIGAALGYLALHAQDSVLLAPYTRSDFPARMMTGASLETQFLKSLDGMECLRRDGSVPARWLESLPSMRGDCLCVILTDFQDQSAMRSLVHEFARRKARVLVICVIDEEELTPSLNEGYYSGAFLHAQSEERLRLRVQPEVLTEYRKEVDQFRQAVEHLCQQQGASRYEVLASESMESIVFALAQAGFIRAQR